MNSCDGSCNTEEHSVGRKFVPNKMGDVCVKVFNMIKRKKCIKYAHKDVTLMVENLTPDKNETMIIVSISVKSQCDITCAKNIFSGIQLHALACVIKIVRLVNTS